MRFQTLAETFARLEDTSSRRRIVELLADLFRRVPAALLLDDPS